MPTYIGFTTKNVCDPKTTNDVGGVDNGYGGIRQPVYWGNKYQIVDGQLVVQDFINALNIRKGSKPGQPGYGTIIFDLLFEQNDANTQFQLENEIRRVAAQDARLILNYVKSFPKENGILIEVELAIQPFNKAQILNLFLNNETSTVNQV